MMPRTERSSRGLLRIVAITSALALLAGCNGQAEAGATLGDFVLEFARSALAAFFL